MLATPHILVGAAVASKVRQPWLAMSLAIGSHFVLDFIPHLDSHGLFGVAAGTPARPEVVMALLDALSGAALVVWLVARRPNRRLLVTAAFLAVAVDLVDNVPPWNAWLRSFPVALRFSIFHHSIQHSVASSEWVLGFGTQIAVIVSTVWVLLSVRRSKGSERRCA